MEELYREYVALCRREGVDEKVAATPRYTRLYPPSFHVASTSKPIATVGPRGLEFSSDTQVGDLLRVLRQILYRDDELVPIDHLALAIYELDKRAVFTNDEAQCPSRVFYQLCEKFIESLDDLSTEKRTIATLTPWDGNGALSLGSGNVKLGKKTIATVSNGALTFPAVSAYDPIALAAAVIARDVGVNHPSLRYLTHVRNDILNSEMES